MSLPFFTFPLPVIIRSLFILIYRRSHNHPANHIFIEDVQDQFLRKEDESEKTFLFHFINKLSSSN